MLIPSNDRTRRGRAALACALLIGGVAVAACSSPTPRTPGGTPGATAEGGVAPVDPRYPTNAPPGPDPAMLEVGPAPTIDPDAPYPPPPVPTVDPYPAPDEVEEPPAEGTATAPKSEG